MRIDSANIQLLKAISAGDTIQINQKYEPTYSYKPYAKLIFCTNRLPSIADRSYGFNRRLNIIPFNKTYYSNPKDNTQPKADKSLLEKILPELDGIFNFAIEGLKRLQDNDYTFSYSEKSENLLEEYKLDINPYLDFAGFAIEEGADTDKIDVKKLHEVFVQWCGECNHSQLSNVTIRTFLREIRLLFKSEGITYREGKSNGSNLFHNIKFTVESKKELHIVTPNPILITLPKPPKTITTIDALPINQK